LSQSHSQIPKIFKNILKYYKRKIPQNQVIQSKNTLYHQLNTIGRRRLFVF